MQAKKTAGITFFFKKAKNKKNGQKRNTEIAAALICLF